MVRDHPRIRGEHYDFDVWCWNSCGSSPHTRGALLYMLASTSERGIIPAYAGSTCRRSAGPERRWDHPRIRGEHPVKMPPKLRTSGSSPHTRGALLGTTQIHALPRIIPAYAGSTGVRRSHPAHLQDHPRIRGEHSLSTSSTLTGAGSSPHTRGARISHRRHFRPVRIIPAYAGSTSIAECSTIARRDHPRIRGEHRTGGV